MNNNVSKPSEATRRSSGWLRSRSEPIDEVSLGLLRRIRLQSPDLSSSYAIGFTSCLAREGASTIAMNVAVAAADTDSDPVVFVDTNVAQRSSITRSLRLQPIESELDSDGSDLFSSRFLPSNLHVFGWPNVEVASKADYVEQLNQLRSEYSTVIVDLPKADEMTSCSAIGRLLDGVVLVVEAERTKKSMIERAVDQMKNVGVVVMGIVYNKQKEHVPAWLR